MHPDVFKSKNVKLFWFVAAIILTLSLGAHALGIHHDHPHFIFGEGLSATLHIGEQKWWLVLLLIAIALNKYFLLRKGVSYSKQNVETLSHDSANTTGTIISIFFNPIRLALRRGIIHPKIYR